MNQKPRESDWKHFKVIRENALQRLCQRALNQVRTTASDESRTPHESYLKVYEQIHEFDRQIADGFNDHSRSKMLMQVVLLRKMKLIEDDEFETFSSDVKDYVANFSANW